MKTKSIITLFIALVMGIVSVLMRVTTVSAYTYIDINLDYMPMILDDSGIITDEVEYLLLAEFSEAYPDTDLSEFTLVYSEINSGYSTSNPDVYRCVFDVYYQDILVHNNGPSLESMTTVSLYTNDEPYIRIFSYEFIKYCLSLDFSVILSEDYILENIDYGRDYLLNEANLISVDFVILDEIDSSLKLAYYLMYDYPPDSTAVFYYDAYNGELLREWYDFDESNTITTSTTVSSHVTATSTTITTTVSTTSSSVTIQPDVLYGDINLDTKISLIDIVYLNKHNAEIILLNEQQLRHSDCNADGIVSSDDTISLMKFIVNLIDALPENAS